MKLVKGVILLGVRFGVGCLESGSLGVMWLELFFFGCVEIYEGRFFLFRSLWLG